MIHHRHVFRGSLALLVVSWTCAVQAGDLVPAGWNPKLAGDAVLSRLVNVTAPQVKGAHDSHFLAVGERAFVVSMCGDVRPGEAASWPEIYVVLAVVNLNDLKVERIIEVARGEQKFKTVALPVGACFVPRILPVDENTLRVVFASEQPGKRQAQTWYRDFDLKSMEFEDDLHPMQLKTASGVFPMQPQPFYDDAVRHGFKKPASDYGQYLFDPYKKFDGTVYGVMNNYITGQHALVTLNDACDTVEIVGHFNEPQKLKLTEAAVNRLPDGTWLAICRQESGNHNYTFTTSPDGRTWSVGAHRPFVTKGASSKPTFDKFGDVYYLGWQEATQIDGVSRSVFNVDISRDGETWERKYRFETPQSFQYPTFQEHDGAVWLSVTQGDYSDSRKERIMFGKLETTGAFEPQK